MAHNLATVNGQIAMAYQGETPWHKLGSRMPSLTNVEQVLSIANLANWNLQAFPMNAVVGDQSLAVPMRRAIVRQLDSTVVSTVGTDFEILQNEDAFAPLQDACDKFGVTIESAGALGRGERVWMLAKMRESIEPVPGDTINGYLLMMIGHDGFMSYMGRLTPIRVVCQNTLTAALSSKGSDIFKFRHTRSIVERSKLVETMLTSMVEALEQTGETFGQLASRQMNAEEISEYIDGIFPAPAGEPSDRLIERRNKIVSLVFNGKGAREFGNVTKDGASAWATYNAVIEYLDHVRPAEAGTSGAKFRANESALFGANAKIKLAALKAARQLVAV